MSKICIICNTEFPLDLFKKDNRNPDGRAAQCKECHNRSNRAYKRRNKDRIKKYAHEYNIKNRARLAIKYKKWVNDNRDKILRYNKECYKRNPEKHIQKVLKYQALNPEKIKAHQVLRTAVKQGMVIKPEHCSNCNKPGKIEGHHDDYSKPLDVDWLCTRCHKNLNHLKKKVA